jgi:endoglucanase
MRRTVKHQLLVMSMLTALVGACGSEYAGESETSTVVLDELTSADGKVSAVLALESDWGSGYRAKITLTSSSSTPTTGWTVGVSLNGSQMTSADLSSVSPRPPTSGPVTITNLSWNAAVSSSSSVSFGFNGSGSGRPTVTSITYTGGTGTGGTGGTGTGGTSGSGGTGGSTGASGGSGGSGAIGGSGATGGTGGSGATGGSSGSGGSGATGGSGGSSSGTNPFAGTTLYVDNDLQACRSSSTAGRAICSTPQAAWIGNWSGNVADAVRNSIARAGSQLRVLVAYNIYNRDCGGQSAGGASSPQAYRDWITAFANGVGNSRVAVILEPDALAHNCGANSASDSTSALLKYAVDTIEARPNAAVYIDAGHARWVSASDMANRLKNAGIANAAGFALNVSNFQATDITVSYGKQVAGGVGGKPFVIDTSRNGLGSPDTQWCNPRPRGLGKKPTAATGDTAVHAFLWIKRPGESDGACNGGPGAGQWYEDYAVHLYSNARF